MNQAVSLSLRTRQRQQREGQLLQLARHIVQQEGFAALTMDRLTALSDVSKGTIYNHFCSKEDVLTALSISSLQRLNLLFQLAVQHGTHSRECALALHYCYCLFGETEPALFLCLFSAATPAVLEKASPERLAQRLQLEQQLLAQCEQLIQQAVMQHKLPLQSAAMVSQYAYLNWALAFGSNALFAPGQHLGLFNQMSLANVCLQGVNLLFDGMGWQPLSAQQDYYQYWRHLDLQLKPGLLDVIHKELS
jgi:AcrR family transcriptional regulator